MTNKKPTHILVVSDPPAAPGYLPRLRYLCDYLTRKGYAVTLLTEAYQPMDFAHTYPIETIPMYNGGLIDWTIKTVWTLLTDWHNRAFARKAISGQSSVVSRPFDLVLCSAFSDFPLGAAHRIAKALNVPLICDVRDLDEQVDDSRYQYKHQYWWTMPFRRLYRAVHIRRRNQVLRAADAVTTVSPWHVDFIKRFNPRTHLVYNGYDPKQFYPEDVPAERFTVTYIGSLFDWQQPALVTVKDILASLPEDIRLEVHTPQHGAIEHHRLGDAIRHSGIMLVFTHPGTHGMLTTKFFEALGCGKPVLCVPSDQGSLAELIAYTNAGIATDDRDAIRAFIADQYAEWQQRGFTRQAVEHREQFSRETQCVRMEAIIKHLIQ